MADWKDVKDALRRPPSPEAQKEAAKKLDEYIKGGKLGKGQTLYIATLTAHAPYPTVMPLPKLGEEVAKSTPLYEAIRKMAVGKE